MKVENMVNSKGNKVPNQFIVKTDDAIYFQSYDSVIVKQQFNPYRIFLDKNKWDYSTTTGKYRNMFLGKTKKEIQAKIDDGTYILTDLN